MPVAIIDSKGRFQIPQAVRDALGIKPGDTVFYGYEDGELKLRRAEDPYGPVARAVWDEHAAGKTRRLEEVAAEYGVDLTAVGDDEQSAVRGSVQQWRIEPVNEFAHRERWHGEPFGA